MDLAVVISTSIATISFLGGGFALSYRIGRHTGTIESASRDLKKMVEKLSDEYQEMGRDLASLVTNTGNLDKRLTRIEGWIDRRVNGKQCAAGCDPKEPPDGEPGKQAEGSGGG
jgi:hypothetical protein